MSKVQKLDQNSINSICANQVVIDLSTCLKELIENALDASSTFINIYLHDYGRERWWRFRTTAPEFLRRIWEKSLSEGVRDIYMILLLITYFFFRSTSKLSEFEDLTQVQTYGFRGEALNSIATQSQS
jgi:DNA mismatch repair protein PMS2